MNADLWHAHARAVLPQPDPVDLRALMMLSEAARAAYLEAVLRWVGNLHLDATTATDVTVAMDEVIDANRYTPPGAKTLIGLTAPNTAGKSTLVRRWAVAKYRGWVTGDQLDVETLPAWQPRGDLECDRIPIVWINLQAAAARKEFNAHFLHFCGYPGEGVTRATSERVATAIAHHDVRLVVVDDVHLLRTHHKDGQTVLDHLKFINTILGEHHATLALVGANLTGGDLLADPQIAGRLRLLQLPTFPIDAPEQKLAWQQLLKAAETQLAPYLPHAEPGFLATQAGLVWRRTQGYLGDLGNLLRQTAHQAIRAQQWAITPDELAAVPLSDRARNAEQHLLNRPRPRKAVSA
ncbi:MAG: TniB family NTP-binding protein [Phycicoccus sp.]